MRSPEENSFNSAKQRCRDRNHHNYALYGGRGIEFRFDSVEQLVREIGPRTVGHTLDRIDNNGHYEPGNVRWATVEQQSRNRSTNKVIVFEGLSLTVKDWERLFGMKKDLLGRRLRDGCSFVEAVTTRRIRRRPSGRQTREQRGCSVPDCPNKHNAKGYCTTHYIGIYQKQKKETPTPSGLNFDARHRGGR